MKKKTISAITIAMLAGSIGTSKAAVFTARTDRKETAVQTSDEFVSLKTDPAIAAASGERPGDQSPDVMKKKSSKKSSSKKKSSKAS